MSLSTCGVHEFCREKFKFSPQWNIVVQIDPFPELFYTLLKHQTTPLVIEVHFDPYKYEFSDMYNSWWFCVHKLSMFIYLSMITDYNFYESLLKKSKSKISRFREKVWSV